eukprot:scaffold22560_cov135-Cylindrotheca_fusiformis.AAC.83
MFLEKRVQELHSAVLADDKTSQQMVECSKLGLDRCSRIGQKVEADAVLETKNLTMSKNLQKPR